MEEVAKVKQQIASIKKALQTTEETLDKMEKQLENPALEIVRFLQGYLLNRDISQGRKFDIIGKFDDVSVANTLFECFDLNVGFCNTMRHVLVGFDEEFEITACTFTLRYDKTKEVTIFTGTDCPEWEKLLEIIKDQLKLDKVDSEEGHPNARDANTLYFKKIVLPEGVLVFPLDSPEMSSSSSSEDEEEEPEVSTVRRSTRKRKIPSKIAETSPNKRRKRI